ncbi:hypothetical protein cypCar_00018248 [Cyprinus carpio]|nr:hypothetical protein cypCar_00018248 [Cyprinus carpio]
MAKRGRFFSSLPTHQWTALVVWVPASPTEKIVRVLFPGNAPQNKIFEGLEKLRHLDFLRYPVATQKDLSSGAPPPLIKQTKMKLRTDSKESLKSSPKMSSTTKASKKEANEDIESKSDSVKENKVEKKDKKIKETVKTPKPLKPKTASPDSLKQEKKKLQREKSPKKHIKEKASKMEEKKDQEKKDTKKEKTDVKKEDVKKELKSKEEKKKEKEKIKPELRKITKPDLKPFTPEVRKTLNKAKVQVKPKTEKTKAAKEQENRPAAKQASVEKQDSDRSLVSSPEDLTKDFEALRMEEELSKPTESKVLPIVQSAVDSVVPHIESPDEGITTTDVETESPHEEMVPYGVNEIKSTSKTTDRFEDEGVTTENDIEDDLTTKLKSATTSDFLEMGENKEWQEKAKEEEKEFEKKPKKSNSEEEEDVIEKAELEEAEDFVHEEELKYKSDEARKEKLGKDWETKQSYIKSAKPLGAAEHVSFIQDETIPGYSETEQTISDEDINEETEERIPHLRYDVGSYDISVPDEPGTFDTIHGMKPPSISVASELSSKGFAVDQEPVLSAYATNIIVAPLAEEEHISSATSITEYDKLSSFATSVTEDQSMASTDATQGKEYLHSAGTISPTSSLEEDKCFKSPPSEEYQPIVPETETTVKATVPTNYEDEEDEEEDEDQTPNVDMPLGKIHEGYASAAMLQDTEQASNKFPTSTAPISPQMMYVSTQEKDEKEISLSKDESKLGTSEKCLSFSPNLPCTSETSIISESEERCLSPDDSTVRFASPTQSGPTSSSYSPTEERSKKPLIMDKEEKLDKETFDSQSCLAQEAPADKTSVKIIDDEVDPFGKEFSSTKPALYDSEEDEEEDKEDYYGKGINKVCGKTKYKEERECNFLDEENSEETSPLKEEKQFEIEKESVDKEDKPQNVTYLGHECKSQMLSSGEEDESETEDGTYSSIKVPQGKLDSMSASQGKKDASFSEIDDPEHPLSSDISTVPTQFQEEKKDTITQDYNFGSDTYGKALGSSTFESTLIHEGPKDLVQTVKDKFSTHYDGKDLEFDKQKTPDGAEKKSGDPVLLGFTSASLSTSRQFGDEIETPASTGFEYSSFKDEHSPVMDSPFSSSCGQAKNEYLEVSEKLTPETTTAESTSNLARFSPLSPFEEIKPFPPHADTYIGDKKQPAYSTSNISDQGPQSKCFYKSEWDEDSRLQAEFGATGLDPSMPLTTQKDTMPEDLYGASSTLQFECPEKQYYEDTESSEEEDDYMYETEQDKLQYQRSPLTAQADKKDTTFSLGETLIKDIPSGLGSTITDVLTSHASSFSEPTKPDTANGPAEVTLSAPEAFGGSSKVGISLSEIEMQDQEFDVKKIRSPSEWEMQQQRDIYPGASPPHYRHEDEYEEEEENEPEHPARPLSLSSIDQPFQTSYYADDPSRHDDDSDYPSDVGIRPHSSTASPGYSSCEYKQRRGDTSPSFINPSLCQFTNDEENEEQRSQASDQQQPSGKTRSHKQPHHHSHSHHGEDSELQHFSGAMAAGISDRGEDTPPTSVSEPLHSQSDSDIPPGTEECPSITAEGNNDSDEDADYLPVDKSSGAYGGKHYSSRSPAKNHDPFPSPMMDPAPCPPRPDVCMVDPEALSSLTDKPIKKDSKTKGLRKLGKTKSSSPARKSDARRKRSPSKEPSTHTTSLRKKEMEDDLSRSSLNTGKGLVNGLKNSAGSNSAKFSSSVPPGPPIYVDLAYIPNHCSAKNVDQEFFKRVRSSYYVVTLIPTHDTEVTREWYQQTHEKQQELNIMVLASSSTVVMQDESFPACKIEF